ncbi:Bbp16 family capsid cement protein [Micromonospora rifamycinica]|uniref:Bbp16 family capsid cement protein n=1 Tax=Micromonospora rifamycinica TaxID=291594 RepID=UPI0033ED7D90
MSRRDLVSSINAAITLAPAARTTTANGTAVDLNGYEMAAAVITSGTITDGSNYVFEVQHSDDNSTWAAVADDELVGAEPTLTAADDNAVRKIGYRGRKRYLRVSLSSVTGSPSTGGVLSAVIIRSGARVAPLS